MPSPSKLSPSFKTVANATGSELTARRLLSGPLLEVSVGEAGMRWSIHRNLLQYHSKLFQDAEQGTSKHTIPGLTDGKLDLTTEEPSAFRILVKWLYQGNIDDVSSMGDDRKWDYAFACQHLYLLCERLGLRKLQNLAIDQFRRGCHESRLVPGADEIIPIYQRLPAKSPFRKLVSRIAARQIMDPAIERNAEMYRACFQSAPDFAVDVMNAIRQGTGGLLLDDPTDAKACRYHIHENEETCEKSVHFHKDDFVHRSELEKNSNI